METGDRVWREQALRSAVLAGDERAWRQWYEASFPSLLAYVSWRCAGLRDLTEEVIQDTWLIAVRRIRRFDPEAGSFEAWLRGIAANVLRNHWRGRRRLRARTEPLNGQDPAALPEAPATADRERAERITRALACLPERYEAALRAKYLDGQTVAQIAEACGETPKAIESLLTRARQAFRDAYAQRE